MYQALYRKYRPRSFADVSGQRHITETLCNQVKTDRLSHAYLFVGTRGTGKTTCAKILSRAVNCLNPIDGNPCNECSSCTGIENGTILDVLELDAASNNGVDDVRAMRDEAIYSPSFVKKRVYIVDEVHMLSTPAFNALLKILEEPPEHIIFILATTEMHKVLPTIQSRCQKFMFRRLTPEEIAKRLGAIASGEKMTLLPEAASMLATLADGSMRDGISLLDQCATVETIDLPHVRQTLGLATEHELLGMVKSIAKGDAIATLDILDGLYKDGRDMAALLNELSGILRDLLVVRLATSDTALLSSSLTKSELSEASNLFTAERLFYCLETAKNALLGMSRAGITKLAMEMCLIRMSDERLSDDTAALASRISRLEEGSVPATPTRGRAQDPPLQSETPPPPTLTRGRAQDPPLQSETPPSPAPSDNILPNIMDKIDDVPLQAMLSDSSKVRAKHDDDTLTLYMTNTFNAEIIKNTHLDTLKEAAKKTFGKETAIHIETEQSSVDNDKQSKLDELLAFGDIVKVE